MFFNLWCKTLHFLGLILVPNGESLGYSMGDPRPPSLSYHRVSSHRTTAQQNQLSTNDDNSTFTINETIVNNSENIDSFIPYNNSHPWGVLFTILGTVLLDFDADACQSPARAYLLDVTVPGM